MVLLGNPNVGKSTLFTKLTGVRTRATNFPGTTQDALVGRLELPQAGGEPYSNDRSADEAELIDLPGVYSLNLASGESEICRAVLDGSLAPLGCDAGRPDAIVVVADATNLVRNLVLVGQAIRLGRPVVLAVNMTDEAARRGLRIDAARLAAELGAPVALTCARTGEGVERLRESIARLVAGVEASVAPHTEPAPERMAGAATAATPPPADQDELERWADRVYAAAAEAPAGDAAASDRLTDRLDLAFTHPLLGVAMFAVVMTGLFYVIFALAAYPMEWIDQLFATLGGAAQSALPAGPIRDLITDGVIAGVGATVIFLPQICLLFFLLSLLEHSGYLARAAFVIDRVLRPFGLSGHAFVPLLSSHACALPGIIAARTVPDRRDRLATILVAPFMSCTARIPVYVLLTSLLFPKQPAMQALAFTGCYVFGAVAGLLSALIARRTFLRGRSGSMALELPAYRAPSVTTAVRAAAERGWMFLKKAGVLILGVSMVLWWLGEYPSSAPPPEAEALAARAETIDAARPELAEELRTEANALADAHAARRSFLGRIGSTVQPIFEPLGADRQLTIGIIASFAAREVFVSTMAVQVVATEPDDDESVFTAIATAERDDGSPLFDPATSWALLVYYVLAMQCLPTLVVTAREAGSWKWAALQLGWMSGLAYVLAAATHAVVSAVAA